MTGRVYAPAMLAGMTWAQKQRALELLIDHRVPTVAAAAQQVIEQVKRQSTDK